MKSLMIAAAVAAVLAASSASAEVLKLAPYASIGGANDNTGGRNIGVVQGRIGTTLTDNFAVEGEFSGGIKADHGVSLKDQEAAFLVAKVAIPVAPQVDLFARLGYSHVHYNIGSDNGVAYGAGGQYNLTSHDGIRVDYTHHNYNHLPSADVWALSYVRKF